LAGLSALAAVSPGILLAGPSFPGSGGYRFKKDPKISYQFLAISSQLFLPEKLQCLSTDFASPPLRLSSSQAEG
jgi:hypothetical protein